MRVSGIAQRIKAHTAKSDGLSLISQDLCDGRETDSQIGPLTVMCYDMRALTK